MDEIQVEVFLQTADCTPEQIHISLEVFSELCAKSILDINPCYSDAHKLPYFTGRSSEDSELEYFLPWSVDNAFTMEKVESLQHELCPSDGEKRLTLACVDDDATIVMYSLTNGIFSPQSSDCFFRHKNRLERQAQKAKVNANTA